ncbi:MAG: cytochrome c3 family protein [Bacteroidota bacterium]
MKTVAVMVVATGVVIVGVFLYRALRSEKTAIQPIAYSHKIHIENAGLTCVDCHATVETSASAAIPDLALCTNCHSDAPLSQSPEEAKLRQYVAGGNEIPWMRIYTVPDHVYFSHRRHVIRGEVQCPTCHGNVAEYSTPITSAFLPVTMENCMRCHRERKVSNDCLSCHR